MYFENEVENIFSRYLLEIKNENSPSTIFESQIIPTEDCLDDLDLKLTLLLENECTKNRNSAQSKFSVASEFVNKYGEL